MADQETTEGQGVEETVDAQDVATTEASSEAGAERKHHTNNSKMKKPGTPQKGTKRSIEEREAKKRASKPAKVKGLQSPRWWAPLMVTLMIVGLLIVVTAYVMRGDFPVKDFGNGNLFIGFGFMILGFLMTLGWK